jgi:polysaccharide export outer membrane protein
MQMHRLILAGLTAGTLLLPAGAAAQAPAAEAPAAQAPAPQGTPPSRPADNGANSNPGTTSGTTTNTTGVTDGTAGTTTAAHAATAPVPTTPDYRLAIGDKLRVEVYKDSQLSQSLQVRPDGRITLPLIGDVRAAGLTPTELRDQIATSLKEYVTNPVVTVIVVETVAPSVFIMGEVNNPGSIPMNGPMTIMQALAMAGGFKDFANTKNIRVLRKTSRGVQTLPFNYKDAAKGEGELVMLAPGDTIIVP